MNQLCEDYSAEDYPGLLEFAKEQLVTTVRAAPPWPKLFDPNTYEFEWHARDVAYLLAELPYKANDELWVGMVCSQAMLLTSMSTIAARTDVLLSPDLASYAWEVHWSVGSEGAQTVLVLTWRRGTGPRYRGRLYRVGGPGPGHAVAP